MQSPRRKREVFYTLERENDQKTICLPVATYPRYVLAEQDGLQFHNKGGWHMKIQRHSIPVAA